MVRWELVAGLVASLTSLALVTLVALRRKAHRTEGATVDSTATATVATTSPTSGSVNGTDTADMTCGACGSKVDSESHDIHRKCGMPLPMSEMFLIAVLVLLLVRTGALLGHTSEEQVKSGILPAEQVEGHVLLCFFSVSLLLVIFVCFSPQKASSKMINRCEVSTFRWFGTSKSSCDVFWWCFVLVARTYKNRSSLPMELGPPPFSVV